jgi:hypothetical protein
VAFGLLAAGALTAVVSSSVLAATSATTVANFGMKVSSGAATCQPNAQAQVHIQSTGPVEVMTVQASGLRPNTDFDLFVIQVPTAPFGIGWYQGDLQTDANGSASGRFIGRFSIETFAVAPGVATAPQVFTDPPFPDATENPAFNPVQMYHLGLWFNSPDEAASVGCANTVTAFNGEHNAGIQVLNTAQYPIDKGPLKSING